jgi:protein involved in polysaccharide export with SLBB domain
MKPVQLLLSATVLFCSGAASSFAQDRSSGPNYSGTSSASNNKGGANNNSGANIASAPIATDPGYRLSIGDEVTINIHGQGDMSTAQRIDKKGAVRIPYVTPNEVGLASKTVREAEGFLETLLVEKKILKKPLVSITVREYSTREVTIIGGVGSGGGIFNMPREYDSIEIVELVTRMGGFKPTAKSNAVRVTRTDDNGRETTQEVDVEAMIYGKRNALKSFLIYPGDKIIIHERLF